MDQEHMESTSDERVTNNSVRQQYRKLSDYEKDRVDQFKGLGQQFIDAAQTMKDARPEAAREFALAITHMEDAVMRAVRGVTQ